MNVTRSLLALTVLSVSHQPTYGQPPVAVPHYGARYAEIKTWHEQALELGASAQERAAIMRSALRARYGDRGMNSLFKNLAGEGAIDLAIPGVEKNLLLATADSNAVAKGARRTHLYATKLSRDPRFRLLGINQPTETPLGATDKDIHYRHVSTGTEGRIEVKDATPDTQKANLATYKVQLEKMALAREETGELQAWVNRKDVIPELREFGEHLGILMCGNVATGEQSRLKSGTRTIESVDDELSGQHAVYSRAKVIEGSASVAFGALVVYQSGPSAFEEGGLLLNPETRLTGIGLKFGQDVSYTVSGLAIMTEGTATLAARVTSNSALVGRLGTIGRFSAPVAAAAFLAAEGFTVSQYMGGYMTGREFARHSAGLVGGLVGSAGGAWAGVEAGGLIGSLFGPPGTGIGAIVGGVVGGFGGGFAAASAAGSSIESWYRLKDAEEQESLRKFIYERYGATP